MLSVVIAGYVFYVNQEISRTTVRPFVVLTAQQITAGVPSLDSKTHVLGPPIGGFVYIFMENFGSTPAYDVEYEIHDEQASCSKLAQKLTLAPHEKKQRRAFCTAPKMPKPGTLVVAYPKCKVIYTDAYKQRFNDPCSIGVQFGLPFFPDAEMLKHPE